MEKRCACVVAVDRSSACLLCPVSGATVQTGRQTPLDPNATAEAVTSHSGRAVLHRITDEKPPTMVKNVATRGPSHRQATCQGKTRHTPVGVTPPKATETPTTISTLPRKKLCDRATKEINTVPSAPGDTRCPGSAPAQKTAAACPARQQSRRQSVGEAVAALVGTPGLPVGAPVSRSCCPP